VESPVITEKQWYSSERAQVAMLKTKHFLGVKRAGMKF
jgi:hypothetical protein